MIKFKVTEWLYKIGYSECPLKDIATRIKWFSSGRELKKPYSKSKLDLI